ncbi:uncharacterized protein LOC107651290 [Monodelphis domestica]|uniref:uncharacterized protein LOC107651290 n=1 Tax=Monodelphis domestica TaxID=13616 RepID=UPI0024E243C9|nr:uncharacterized protein LOC107651290 [Monodelphis domestica]
MENGIRKAGYSVVSQTSTTEAKGLSPGNSAQKSKLIALTRALQLAEGKKANVFTDSKYAFHVLHVHGAIWKERGLLTTKNSPLKDRKEVPSLFEAVTLPSKIAVIYCRGHQGLDSNIAQGNHRADLATKEAARATSLTALTLTPLYSTVPMNISPSYTEEEIAQAEHQGLTLEDSGWWCSPSGPLILPKNLMWKLVIGLHNSIQLGKEALTTLIKPLFTGKGISKTIQEICRSCALCAQTNSTGALRPPPLLKPIQRRGESPGEDWQIDFIHLPHCKRYKTLLVFVDTFIGWPEAFPSRSEKAQDVTKALLNEIIPRFGLPKTLQSDNGTGFISQITQMVSKELGITIYTWPGIPIFRENRT